MTVPVTAPFRLDLTAWVLRRRDKNTIDSWTGRTYSRVLTLPDTLAFVSVAQELTEPRLAVRLQSVEPLSAGQLGQAEALVHKTLGLDIDVSPFYELMSHDARLARLAELGRGVRPPRFPSVFEALVNAIACQQVSLDVGILLLDRLCDRYGGALDDGDRIAHAFPRPKDLIDVSEPELKELGFSRQKALTIKEVADRTADGSLQLEQLESSTNEEALNNLQSIKGIGRWSAEYVLLRGLGRLDVFPGDDVGGQNNLQKLLGLRARPGYDELKEITSAWRPYAGFIYFHLLLSKLHDKGFV